MLNICQSAEQMLQAWADWIDKIPETLIESKKMTPDAKQAANEGRRAPESAG
jgi:hypothetical protein